MPYTTQTSDFYGWYLRHNSRVVWKHLSDAGIDVFATGPNNNTQAFLDLTNVLPGMAGGFYPRWGLQATSVIASNMAVPVRTFFYNVPQDASDPTNTATRNLIIGTDNQNFATVTDGFTPYSGYGPVSLTSSGGTINALTSRNWFYYGNGKDLARKVNPSYTTKNTDFLLGIDLPRTLGGTYSLNYQTTDTYADYPHAVVVQAATGKGYPPNTIIDATDSHGTGYQTYVYDPTKNSGSFNGSIQVATDSYGQVVSATITNEGSTYSEAVAVIGLAGQGSANYPPPTAAAPAGGTQAYVMMYVQQNPAGHTYGSLAPNQGFTDLAGPMSFVAGRQYAVALQNSVTGHTSDVFVTNLSTGPKSGTVYNSLTSIYNNPVIGYPSAGNTSSTASFPIYVSSYNQTAGFTQLQVLITVPAIGLDPQVDTIILLATSDGGSVGTLYQVASIPLSSFTLSGGSYTYTYFDNLPDAQNNSFNTYGTPDLLLESDIWAETSSDGTTNGITLNTPPTASGFLYPVLHQGRMFATDGKTVFYSKSLAEVTTSTGLITAKWEECWPGDYQLPVALNNETIVALKSDGTNLHIGTNKSIYTCYGSGPSDFSIPSQAFAETGVLSNDLWTVIFVEGQPAGYVWLTPDFKVMHSDFSTYQDIGTGIYPFLTLYNSAYAPYMKMLSLTQGPYNFVVLALETYSPATSSTSPYWFNYQAAPYNGGSPVFFIWETRLKKWFRWLPPNVISTSPGAAFVYQAPGVSSSLPAGSRYLFYWSSSGTQLGCQYFNPFANSDLGLQSVYSGFSGAINWNVHSSWQDCEDSTAIKVANEIELTSNNTTTTGILSPPTVTLWGATSEAQFLQGGNQLKSGLSISGPLASLQTLKLYCAGTPTAAKYYSVQIQGQYGATSVSSAPAPVLSSFSLERFPIARI